MSVSRKVPQPLDHRQLFFLQVRHHFGDEVGCGTLELRPAVGIDTILEDPGGDPTHTPRQRPDDHVLVGQERRQLAAASRADEREQNRFLEGVVVDDLVERDDELLEMLLGRCWPFLARGRRRRTVLALSSARSAKADGAGPF